MARTAKTEPRAKRFRIKKGDTVEVIQGKQTGKRGKVLRVVSADERIVIEREAGIHISNVKLVCPSCSQAVRVGVRMEGEDKVRYCKKCNVQVDKG